MKLAKLLGAGKSFFGGKGSVSYREDKRVYLPKFNSAKNPFASKPKEAEAAGVKAVAESFVAAPVVAARLAAETQKIATPPTSKPVPAKPVPSKPVPAKPARAGWADKLNPFRAPQPAAPQPEATVQPELSLDAVKVLHNDLSDADVEVVPVKSRTIASAPAASSPMDYMNEPVLRTI